jgi:hypothetical protein
VKKIGISTENLPSVAQATAAIRISTVELVTPARRHRILKLAASWKSGGSGTDVWKSAQPVADYKESPLVSYPGKHFLANHPKQLHFPLLGEFLQRQNDPLIMAGKIPGLAT